MSKRAQKATSKKAKESWLERTRKSLKYKPPAGNNELIYRKIFYILFGVFALVMVFLSFKAGMNQDEKVHLNYTNVLLDYYASGGSDKAATFVDDGKMHYYGGLFDLGTGVLNRVMGITKEDNPVGYYNVRHLWNTFFGILALLFTGLFAKELSGWRGANLGLMFYFLSPRILGHSFMNPRDIPFAAGYVITLYFITVLLRNREKFDWRGVAGLAIGYGICLGVRAGALVLLPYAALFVMIDIYLRNGMSGLFDVKGYLPYVKKFGLGFLGGFILAYLFWPFGQQNPVGNLFETLGSFSNYRANIRMLFEGNLVYSRELALVSYISKWLLFTIPIAVMGGFVLSFVFAKRVLDAYPFRTYILALFAFLFPIAYILYKHSTLYDGWRHLIFIYTPFIALASLGWVLLSERIKVLADKFYLTYALVGVLMLPPLIHIVRNPSLVYVYFNPIAGGMNGALGQYETDYWGLSVKEAVKWMEENNVFDGYDENNKLKVSSNFGYPTRNYLNDHKSKVRVMYSRFRERYDKDWDYAIYVGRFIDGAQLRSGEWPSSRAVHAVTVNGVPVAAVYKNLDKVPSRAQDAMKKGKYREAIDLFQQEVANYPNNDIAWKGLGLSYLNSGDQNKAQNAFQKVVELNGDDSQALNYLGIISLNKNEISNARNYFNKALENNLSNYLANYYLGQIAYQSNDLISAQKYVEEALKYNPNFRDGYSLLANIYEKQGDKRRANQIRNQIK